MKQTFMVSLFLIGFFLKIANSIGAESELTGMKDVNVSELDAAILPMEEMAPQDGKLAATSTPVIAEPVEVRETQPAQTASPSIQQNFNIVPTQPATSTSLSQSGGASLTETAVIETSDRKKVALIPMVGGTAFSGRWRDHISNEYSLGLVLEVPINPAVSLEAEGNFGRFNISYSGYGHDFKQYGVGGNLKVYPITHTLIQPYLGAGMMALYYEEMVRFPYSYNRWVGAPQAIVGVDVNVNEGLALGVRGSYLLPLLNRPATADNGYFSYPGYEEAAAINTTFFRVMGTAKVSF